MKIKRTLLLPALFFCLWLTISLADDSDGGKELVYLQLLTTNGLFSPLQLYPNDKNSEKVWPDGLGALTKEGKIQHYELGKLLRKHYENFITSSPTEIDAFSSAEDRSTHSVLCLLASLYEPTEEWEFLPGFHWQPVPVSYLDNDDIFFRYPENCLTEIRERRTVYSTPPGKDIIQKEQFYYSFWSNHSGTTIKNWNDVALLYDTLEKEKLYEHKVPRWAEKYWSDLKRISNAAYGWNYQSVKSLQLKVGSLISFLTLRMRAKVVKPDLIKVSVYMTHDWNLAAFLIASKLFNGHRPPPCATIAIELYRHLSGNQHSVRMLFYNSTKPELGNQKPHVLKLSECKNEYCPLTAFVNHFQDIIIEDFDTLCEKYIETEEDYNKYFYNFSNSNYH